MYNNPYRRAMQLDGLLPLEVEEEKEIVRESQAERFEGDLLPQVSRQRRRNQVENKKYSVKELIYRWNKYKDHYLAFQSLDTVTFKNTEGQEVFAIQYLFNLFDRVSVSGVLDKHDFIGQIIADHNRCELQRAIADVKTLFSEILNMQPIKDSKEAQELIESTS